jgi:cobalt-zinc-cadmium efflux system membrane fusion protein
LLIGISPDNLNENTISRSIAIHSPIDGYVSKVNVNIGKYASPTDVLFELVNPQDIHLALDIFEKDIDNLQIGQKLLAFTNSQPDKKYPCEIILIGKDISETRSVEVHCHFAAYDKSLIPGMYMNAEIEVSSQNDFVIADESIVTFEGKHYVFYEKSKNNFEMVDVEIGNSENGNTQITFKNNFNPEQKQFVIKGAYSILMKSKNTEE